MSYIFPSVTINYITYTAKRWGQFPTITYITGGVAGSEVVTVTDSPMSTSDITIQIENGVSTNLQIKTAILAATTTVGSLQAKDLVDVAITTGHNADVNSAVSATPMTGGSENLPAMQVEVVLKGFKDNATCFRLSGLDFNGAYVQSYAGIFYNDQYTETGLEKTRAIYGGNDGMDVMLQGPRQVSLSAADPVFPDGKISMASSTLVEIRPRAIEDVADLNLLKIDRVDTSHVGTDNSSDINIDVKIGNLRFMSGNSLGTIVIPILTATEITALTPVEGMLVYNITDHKLNVRVAAAWEEITSSI